MNRKWLVFAILVIVSIFLIGCSKDSKSTNKQDNKDKEKDNVMEESIDPLAGKAINPLTGLYVDESVARRRPIGVMINNLKPAIPQSGIGQADVIYETLVEGGICRLFGLFQDFNAKKIGPVRSARHYYLDFAFDHDAIYAHYGRSPQATVAFSDWNSPHLEGLSYLDSIMCFVDSSRVAPHDRYTSYDGLMAAWKEKGYRTELDKEIGSKFEFSELEIIPELTNSANKIVLPFSYYQTSWFEYNTNDRLYYRFQFNDKHIDKETGEQLKFKNIIIQLASIWTIPNDSEGRQDMNLITNGTGYYITNGSYIPITWEKTSHYSPTKYYLEDGTNLNINVGKTWIAVFPLSREDKITIQ